MRGNANSFKHFNILATVLACFSIQGCTSAIVSNATSLSPAIQGGTIANNSALADASDQILLFNILRARDHAPLDMGALSSINGALSLSGTAAFTIPFGSMPKDPTGNSFGPTLNAGTSPTYTFTPLNTQGFTTAILQPVSASYVENRWHAGISPELLMLLFVKQIAFPVHVDPANPNSPVHYIEFVNNPDNDEQFRSFKDLIEVLLRDGAQLQSFDLLDPIGPQFAFLDADKNNQPGTNAFGFVTGANDGQYHVGNGLDGNGKVDPKSGQLYRVFSNQVALCVRRESLRGLDLDVPETSLSAEQKHNLTPSQQVAKSNALSMYNLSVMSLFKGKGGGGPAGGAGTGKPTASTSTSPASGATSQATTTAALQAGRFSSVVDADGCGFSEIVLPPSSEIAFQENSEGFVHVEWRSVSEVFEYLGATLRYNKRHGSAATWTETPDTWAVSDVHAAHQVAGQAAADIIARNEVNDAAAKCSRSPAADCVRLIEAAVGRLHVAAGAGPVVEGYKLFDVAMRGDGRVELDYLRDHYSILDNEQMDQSMIVLSMLGTLVNLSNGSTSVASQPLQLLPIP